jgi:hypothetical protein
VSSLISAPLPDVDLRSSSIVTVDAGDPNAVITQLVIHVSQDLPEQPVKVTPFVPLFSYGPETV